MTPADRSSAALNLPYSKLSTHRRYEVWFLRLALADGTGAWWFRYLLMNLARGGCPGDSRGSPAQIWATWFPRDGQPQSFIEGYPLDRMRLERTAPFSLEIGDCCIRQDACRGRVQLDGHSVEWNLRYRSSFAASLSDVGWIGFSRTPHSDAVFSGEITMDGRVFSGQLLGYGLQGHNCGYRHRHLWTWAHAHLRTDKDVSTFEALIYEGPFGYRVRKALFWHGGQLHRFRRVQEVQRDPRQLRWKLRCADGSTQLLAEIDGSGPSLHRLPYLKTDCSGTFPVSNNSLARARFQFTLDGRAPEPLNTQDGAVLEMVGGEHP